MKGNYDVGRLYKLVDANFIGLAGTLSHVPLALMGAFAAHYERFGIFLDGNYTDLNFKSRSGPLGLTSIGLSTQLGLMDCGLMCRLAGPAPAGHQNWIG